MNEFVEQFLAEARELTEQATQDVLRLEQVPGDTAVLEEVFRGFHTLKGAAGIMEYVAMERLLHAAEDALQGVRSGSRGVDAGLVDALLAGLGQVLRWCEDIERTGGVSANAERDGEKLSAAFAAGPRAVAVVEGDPVRAVLAEQRVVLGVEGEGAAGRAAAARRTALNVAMRAGFDTAALQAAREPAQIIAAIERMLQPAETTFETADVRDAAATTVRVEVARIDALVTLAGELLVAKNAIQHLARQAEEGVDASVLAAGLKTQQDVLARHVADLQRAVFDLRVLPLSRVFGRFPSLVRETAARLGKQIQFRTEGEDTEADKAVVEALFEPLVHIVRNAIDHGVETPAERRIAGKPAVATLTLRAWREADHVVIEVADDGRGVDPTRIRETAIERGVASAAAIAAMDDATVVNLIFAAGFSTTQEVSSLSGRGVGMGAVQAAIHRVGGEVILSNQPGQGLAIQLLLPFGVLMTSVMTVIAGGQMFGVPFDAIVETVRIPRSRVKPLGASEAFVLRNQTLPLVSLARGLGLATKPRDTDEACVLIVWANGAPIGLEVDQPGEKLDVMLKPAEGLLAGIPSIAGTSLMGNGQVLIVLDPATLTR